jgi:hypothetical protein
MLGNKKVWMACKRVDQNIVTALEDCIINIGGWISEYIIAQGHIHQTSDQRDTFCTIYFLSPSLKGNK